MGAELAWNTHTCPDIAFLVAKAAQITQEVFTKDSREYIKRLNYVIEKLRKFPDLKLQVSTLDKNSLRLIIYSDATCANNFDETSQVGYIIFLADGNNKCQRVSWS